MRDRGEPIGERNGLPVYKRPTRKAPLRAREPKAQRKSKPLRASEQLLAAAKPVVAKRSRGTCERCQTNRAEQFHHRLPRKSGGSARRPYVNQPANLLHLCGTCHADIESNRTRAYTLGLLVHAAHLPGEVPVTLGLEPFSHRFLLDDDGGMAVYEEAASLSAAVITSRSLSRSVCA